MACCNQCNSPVDSYCQLQDRIANEIADDALGDEIKLAINDAIKFYSRQKWVFLETSTTFNTVAGTQAYSLPTDYKSMLIVMALVSGSFWKLTPRTFEYLRYVTVLTTTLSPPQDYAIFDGQIWLYPIPDRVYPITEYYDQILTPLVNCADTNIWTQDGEELIRVKAKELLYRHVIRDTPSADEMQAELNERVYPAFRAGYNEWQESGTIRGSYL